MTLHDFTCAKGLKLMAWNVQSLFNKFDIIKYHIESVTPDIVLICETWLSEALNDDIIQIPEYTIVRQDRSSGRGGGLLFYVRNSLSVNSDFKNIVSNYSTCDIESLLISVHLKETLPIYIVGLYRPPSGKIDEYIKKCEKIVENIYLLPKGRKAETMLLGDVNVVLLLSKKCRITSKIHFVINFL